MDNGLNGDFSVIYYGKNVPSLHEYIVTNLVYQRAYRFRIQAENFNGFGDLSDIATFYSCVAPTSLSAPTFVSTTSTSMTIAWEEPTDNGGCPITGYAVFRDDGTGITPAIEINTSNDPDVRNIPTLREVTATLLAADLGTTYKFMI